MKTKEITQQIRSSSSHWVGNGFPVRSVFEYNGLGRELSPFLLLDYAPPHEFSPATEKRGVGAHPHKGFETVTIVYQGELAHRDSSGGGGTIGPGDVQWMTAGRGIIHEEFHSPAFARTGGTLQMLQLWVNLRARDKSANPSYQTLARRQIPVVRFGGGSLRVIAGEHQGQQGPARTFTPINVWDLSLSFGASSSLAIPGGHTTALFLVSGQLAVNGAARALEGDLVAFERADDAIQLEPLAESRVLVLTGEPIEEPIVGHGPFVMNSRTQIQEAFTQYQLGKMGRLE